MDKCPYCGEKTEPRDTFCLNCGHRLLNEHLGIPLQVQTIYEETNRSNEDRIDERDMTTWGDPNIRLSQTEAITQSIERKRGHADVIDQIGDRLLELTITKVQLLNNQRVGIVDDKEVEQTLAVITSLEDILTKTMQIYQSGVRVADRQEEKLLHFEGYKQYAFKHTIRFIHDFIHQDSLRYNFTEELDTAAFNLLNNSNFDSISVQKQIIDVVKNELVRYLTPDKIIAEYTASFLEEAVNDTPNIDTLRMWYEKTENQSKLISYHQLTEDYDPYYDISYGMLEIMVRSYNMKFLKERYLQELFQELEKLNSSAILSAERMRKLGEAIQGVQSPIIPPYMRLHQYIEKAGAYQLLDPGRQRILQTYLTTDQTMTDIQKAEGFKSVTGVAGNVKKSLEMIFPHLPQEVQEEFKSPKEAVRTKSAHHTESSKRRLRQGLDKLKRPDTGKIEFTDTHRQHIADANLRRWQRARETQRASQTAEQRQN